MCQCIIRGGVIVTMSLEECCSMSSAPIDAATADRMAATLKALADPMRLRVLSHIAAQGCESVCACDLLDVVDLSQPTISHHLKKLVDAGLLTRQQRGRWAHYSVAPETFDELRRFLDLGDAAGTTPGTVERPPDRC